MSMMLVEIMSDVIAMYEVSFRFADNQQKRKCVCYANTSAKPISNIS